MDKIIHQLGELLLTALPTFILLILLNYYLKFVFFKPLQKVLQQRYDATEGARKLAEEILQRAEAKTAAYEETLRCAALGNEIYQVAGGRVPGVAGTRRRPGRRDPRSIEDTAIKLAKNELAQEVEATKEGLARDSETLANQIAESILRRRAA